MAKNETSKAKDDEKDLPTPDSVAVDEAAKATKRARKKQILILLVTVLGSLAIGGGGVTFYFMSQKNKSPSAPAAAESTAKAGKIHTPVDTTVYVSLQKLSAPLIDQGRVLGYAVLDLSLEVVDSHMQAKVFEQLPALRAAFLVEVTDHPIGKPDDPTVIDYDNLGKRLLDVANRELKDARVNRVMITQTLRM